MVSRASSKQALRQQHPPVRAKTSQQVNDRADALDEALKLEGALARLRTQRPVAPLHYAPIRATVESEPPEILPCLGTSRLEGPITRHRVDLVFHGHAHHGDLEGRTSTGVPVHNVAMPLLLQKFPGQPPFRVVDLAKVPVSVEQ